VQVNLTRRFSSSAVGNSFFTVGYTWGHEIDNVSGFRQRNSNVPAYDHQLFRASGDTDVRQTFVLSGGWELPFDKLWQHGPKLLTSGWSLYPILTARTGFPQDIFANLNTTRTDPGPSGAGDAGYVRADLVGTTVPILNPRTYQELSNPNAQTTSSGNYYFNPDSFSNARALDLDGSGAVQIQRTCIAEAVRIEVIIAGARGLSIRIRKLLVCPGIQYRDRSSHQVRAHVSGIARTGGSRIRSRRVQVRKYILGKASASRQDRIKTPPRG